ncbi:hypothetical protein DAPPUDRAFT_306263 [Daphnia pulex]|uniref:AB hydrolase-1 domain-containing protein n=1 Tax=Daphnia pulex TaxID=6669 RepID=E9GW68_DAPPU|nr:hypothetical protein DAPPUDRAFT_306263 [Daphnia pulex]|eukprot:EFX76294.1 hypothetical protein DAPPUDRAFT_306263 [Daphnia pulex]
MTDDSAELERQKLLYRLQHIIPRSLSTSSFYNNKLQIPSSKTSADGPQDVEFQMTWGKVAARIWGPPDGRPVFAIHGWLDNAGTFDTLIPLLPKDLRIVAVEMPGHGLSDPFPPDAAYNFMDCLVAIERFAKYFKWEKFSFICHSLGATMSMMYAGIYPDKVDKLIQLDIVRVETTKPESIDYRLRKTVGKLLKYEAEIIAGPEKPFSYEEAIEKCIGGTFGSLDKKACDILFKRGLKKVEGGYVFRRDRRLLAAPLSFAPKEDQLILARKVTADVLIIKCSDGPDFETAENSLEHVEALKTNAKRVQYVIVEGRHHTHLTNPELVAPIITEFFNT